MYDHSRTLDVRTALKEGLAQLRDAHVPSYTLAAELLLLHVLGRERTWIYSHPEEEISSAEADRYFALLARRTNGEPTQHLTGKQEFCGLEFEVTPDVLIPRPAPNPLIYTPPNPLPTPLSASTHSQPTRPPPAAAKPKPSCASSAITNRKSRSPAPKKAPNSTPIPSNKLPPP